MVEGVKRAMELPKKGFLIDDAGDKNYNRITQKGNFDR